MFYLDILEEFYKNDIRYLIVGGLAVNLHGVPRVTQDIDIVISNDKDNILKLIEILTALSYKPRLPVNPEDLAEPDVVKEWIENRNMQAFSFYHQMDNYKVIDIVISHNLNFELAFENKVVKKVNGFNIYLSSIDDLIELKEYSGREQDLSDVEMLKKVRQILEDDNE
ncbi:MAG: hypothetical protein A2X61_13425 [Ignavibacteria bacterium GWB2_35_12]|nr:MAG: hypothetical protein A2X63_12635 [Ignavibacteria bacterium GWA2_35_8]OGU41457.1 MAG: hypothetical protein A2X61_13425 [Ignavibacteria bacterium GWB2_35_12]OGU94979.1 MAG: hypothetical protein A2220_09415 [Ignavibacteria bacterium RIFOXYA2_FULL_35_10]OGV19366.1 MAG: hypothetical protein A2475_04665 [Ignavibacteria bacterium RIFOXYC2_FULL_35_21]